MYKNIACMQESQREDARKFSLAFQAWAELGRMAAECRHRVAQAAAADKLHNHHVQVRSLRAWIEGVAFLWKEKRRLAQRNTLFYRWHERTRLKRTVPSRLRARLKLRGSFWVNEVCGK